MAPGAPALATESHVACLCSVSVLASTPHTLPSTSWLPLYHTTDNPDPEEASTLCSVFLTQLGYTGCL